MNKTKRVAWHKHLKRARHEKEKAQTLARAHAPERPAAARVRPTTTSRPTTRSSAASSRQTTPRP
jgi:hypothetical protein